MDSRSSRKECDKNEKIIRGLLKLPTNRSCINCNNLGPQYVCTDFWTFVCVTCSGIHREFTHRVKSISMAKFSQIEIESLQKGGNQRAREIFLKYWDPKRMKLPETSNLFKLREFVRDVYVDRLFASRSFLDATSKNLQKHMDTNGPELSCSCHSLSRSFRRDEGQKYGKLNQTLSIKPSSDQGNFDTFDHVQGNRRAPLLQRTRSLITFRFTRRNSGYTKPENSDSMVDTDIEPELESRRLQRAATSISSYTPKERGPESPKHGVLPDSPSENKEPAKHMVDSVAENQEWATFESWTTFESFSDERKIDIKDSAPMAFGDDAKLIPVPVCRVDLNESKSWAEDSNAGVEITHDRKSINPFDDLYDVEDESINPLLQSKISLENYFGTLTQPPFLDSLSMPCTPPTAEGFEYTTLPLPRLQLLSSEAIAAPKIGNPFA